MSMNQTNKITCLMISICFTAFTAQSQDFHFSNNEITPTFFNPATTGNFSGTLRAGLIYRNQMFGISNGANANSFQTFGFSGDAPIIFGFSKNHWLAAGVSVNKDLLPLGDVNKLDPTTLITTRFSPSVAYHIGLDKKFKSVVSFGLQYGLSNISIVGKDFLVTNDITGHTGNDVIQDALLNEGLQSTYSSINIGICYKSKLSKKNAILMGLSAMHIQQPEYLLEPIGNNSGGNNLKSSTISRRINLHGSYRTKRSKQLTFEPRVNASFTSTSSNIQLQFRTEYLLESKNDIALIIGAGYRLNGSPQFLTGAIYQDYIISLSYDHNLTAIGEVSANTLELGVSKIFTINKTPEPKPIIYCPRI